jgi:TatD DNase family protein
MNNAIHTMTWFDTHCHLDMGPMAMRSREVVEAARSEGVEHVLAVAYDRASLAVVSRLAELPGVVVALGQHPWVADEALTRDELATLLGKSGAVAIGEIGLDFRVQNAPSRERQIAQLTWQIELAVDLGLPVSLHVRGAWDEMFAVLGRFRPHLRGAVHAFSRGRALAERSVAMGLHVAFGGAVTQENAHAAHEAARVVPLDRLLVETDAPAIAVRGCLAEEVEPRHAAEVGRALAELRGLAIDDLARITTDNARGLFLP